MIYENKFISVNGFVYLVRKGTTVQKILALALNEYLTSFS